MEPLCENGELLQAINNFEEGPIVDFIVDASLD